MKSSTIYECSICGAKSNIRAEIERCEAQGAPAQLVAVGDIVTISGGFGWFDGDRKWIINADSQDPEHTGKPRRNRGLECPNRHGNCFSDCCTFAFYYVVTFIDVEGPGIHRSRYHVQTLAMTGKQGHAGGYTFDVGHKEPTRVARPPRHVIKSSRALLGNRARNLL